jgi:hypothetical protein
MRVLAGRRTDEKGKAEPKMSVEDEALSAVGRWIAAANLRDGVVDAMQKGSLPEDDAQGVKAVCEVHKAEKGLRSFWALYGAKTTSDLVLSAEDDRKLVNLILGLLSRAYELEIGKDDITREKLTMRFVGRPELENLKAAIAAFFREAIRERREI